MTRGGRYLAVPTGSALATAAATAAVAALAESHIWSALAASPAPPKYAAVPIRPATPATLLAAARLLYAAPWATNPAAAAALTAAGDSCLAPGPARYCSPGLLTRFEPWSLELNGTL